MPKDESNNVLLNLNASKKKMGSWVKMLFSRFTKTVNQTQFTLSLGRSIKTKENKKCNIL